MILPTTSKRNHGLCCPCSTGYESFIIAHENREFYESWKNDILTTKKAYFPRDQYEDLKKTGFWSSDEEPVLIKPKDLIDVNWDPKEKNRILGYLGDSYRTEFLSLGYDTCQLCGREEYSKKFTDEVWLFPGILAHYISDHNVKPEIQFIEHVRKNQFCSPRSFDLDSKIEYVNELLKHK